MLEGTKIRVFTAVVEEGNFTKAARRLGVSQPAVSQNIAELENALGVRLFERRKASVALTREGERFKEYVEQINYWCKAAEEAFAPALPKALRGASSPLREVRISVPQGVECRLMPQDAPDCELCLSLEGDEVRVGMAIKKQRDPEGSAAGLWD